MIYLLSLVKNERFSELKDTRDLMELSLVSNSTGLGFTAIVYLKPVMLMRIFFLVMLGILSNSSTLSPISENRLFPELTKFLN
jgi:hypothetical protein